MVLESCVDLAVSSKRGRIQCGEQSTCTLLCESIRMNSVCYRGSSWESSSNFHMMSSSSPYCWCTSRTHDVRLWDFQMPRFFYTLSDSKSIKYSPLSSILTRLSPRHRQLNKLVRRSLKCAGQNRTHHFFADTMDDFPYVPDMRKFAMQCLWNSEQQKQMAAWLAVNTTSKTRIFSKRAQRLHTADGGESKVTQQKCNWLFLSNHSVQMHMAVTGHCSRQGHVTVYSAACWSRLLQLPK